MESVDVLSQVLLRIDKYDFMAQSLTIVPCDAKRYGVENRGALRFDALMGEICPLEKILVIAIDSRALRCWPLPNAGHRRHSQRTIVYGFFAI